MKDEVAGDGAVGDADGGAGGAAEDDRCGDVADGRVGDFGGVGVEVVAVKVNLASGHSRWRRDAVEVRRVGLVVRQEGAERGHGLKASVDGRGGKRNFG